MTIAGLYTIAELKDLIAAKDVELKALADAIAKFDATWKTQDAPVESAWQKDYSSMLSTYNIARSEAEAAISVADLSMIPENLEPADTVYNLVLGALQQKSGVVSPGDFQDLWNRLTTAQGAPIPEPPVPQPSKGSDLDLTWYQTLDKSLPAESNLLILGIAAAAFAAFLAFGHGSSTVVVKGFMPERTKSND